MTTPDNLDNFSKHKVHQQSYTAIGPKQQTPDLFGGFDFVYDTSAAGPNHGCMQILKLRKDMPGHSKSQRIDHKLLMCLDSVTLRPQHNGNSCQLRRGLPC